MFLLYFFIIKNVNKIFILILGGCIKCVGFKSFFICGCGVLVKEYMMIVEMGEEWEVWGYFLGEFMFYVVMGGIIGFLLLVDGY